MNRKAVVAVLIDAAAESFMSYKDYGPAGAAVIGPDGRKHVFTAEQLAKAELAMGMTETLADAGLERTEEEAKAEGERQMREAKKAGVERKNPPARVKSRKSR